MKSSDAARFDVVGACVPSRDAAGLPAPVLGDIGAAASMAARHGAEFVILAGTDDLPLARARRLEWDIEDAGVGLLVASSVSDIAAPRTSVSRLGGLPLMQVQAAQFSGPKRLVKGAVDRAGAVVILAILGLPMLLIALVVKVGSPGPVLFRQERVGRDLQPFAMLKFRSMYTDAESRLSQLAHDSDGNGVLFKMHDDPRVTRAGRLLRRFSLDEAPAGDQRASRRDVDCGAASTAAPRSRGVGRGRGDGAPPGSSSRASRDCGRSPDAPTSRGRTASGSTFTTRRTGR
ncbi:hypothetical protein GCM10025876_14130 [Demequina litorisediminis]|uniref:Bacterial sugar transferase domain-containing protein n=1 Tax=Demequina litorisediminis TaxID=1849022 RepID=A0ABQ6IC02_9MICO|nr:hypothetical protein GCM10025876_14130 [Demequina litorisediminis]